MDFLGRRCGASGNAILSGQRRRRRDDIGRADRLSGRRSRSVRGPL
jgi:hypothetical protein